MVSIDRPLSTIHFRRFNFFFKGPRPFKQQKTLLKGLSHEIEFKNVDENGQILALIRAAAGF